MDLMFSTKVLPDEALRGELLMMRIVDPLKCVKEQ